MKGFKKGFTMVELIFVIVIIGILVSIAMPKLSASRDDAQFYANLASLKQAINNAKSEQLADSATFKSVNKSWLGHINSFGDKNVGPDGACFCVYTNGGDSNLIIMPNSHATYSYFSKCSLDEETRKALEDEAIKLGLLNARGAYKVINLAKRHIKL